MRRDAWLLAATAVVVCLLVAAVMVVRGRDVAKDQLRQAEVALAAAPGAVNGELGSPQALLAGSPAAPSEFTVNRRLRDESSRAMTVLNRHWRSPVARALGGEAAAVNRATARMMTLIGQRRLREANALNAMAIPAGDRLQSAIARANRQLTSEIDSADRTAWQTTLGVVAVSGVLVLLLLIGVAGARRRRTRMEIERRLHRDSERRLKALVEHGSDMITVVDPDTTVIYQAGAVESLLGFEPAALEGAKLVDWLDSDDVPAMLALCATDRTASAEVRLRRRDGSHRSCEVHATSLLHDPAWNGIVLNIWDLSERKALEERLRHQAFHDTLTGLPNRALVLDRAEQMLARARRGSSSVAALYVDLDGLKHLNDSFGQAAGDELLKAVGERLARVVRDEDTVGRLGGDEFVVLLEPDRDNVPPDLIAERLLEVLREPVELAGSGKILSVSASIGIAVGRRDTVDELLRDADFALYEAKRIGRGRHVLFKTRMQTDASDRMALEAELQPAIEAEQFFLLYQPIFDLHTQRVIGVEALARWRHPTRGVISPDLFIPIAEETGAIVGLGRWVLHEACRQAARWHGEGHEIGVAVNVSAHQLDQAGFVRDVRRVLTDTWIDPSALTLEITETALMRDADAAAERLQSLKSLGVRVAIDDFGTGHSSLAYLRRFPVDALKIDRSFIAGLASSSASAAIIHTLVQLGKKLEIETLAEGIEMPAQLEMLQDEDCDQGQGYLFARPLTVSGIEAFLDRGLVHGTRTLANI